MPSATQAGEIDLTSMSSATRHALGPERFKTADPRIDEQIGDALPWWSDAVRAELLAQVRAR